MTTYERIVPIQYAGFQLSDPANLLEFLSESGKTLDKNGSITLGSVAFDPADLVWLREMFPGTSEADEHFTENWDIRPVHELMKDFHPVAFTPDNNQSTSEWRGGLRVVDESGDTGMLHSRDHVKSQTLGVEFWFVKWDGTDSSPFATSYAASSLRLV